MIVMTDLPIKEVFQKPNMAGMMVKWAIKLSEFDIHYELRGPIKGQVYVDFIVELTPKESEENGETFRWILSIDGSSNLKGSGAGIILEGLNGVLLEQYLKFSFKVSNHQAEYEALINGMFLAKELGVRRLLAKSDSLHITRQVSGDY